MIFLIIYKTFTNEKPLFFELLTSKIIFPFDNGIIRKGNP